MDPLPKPADVSPASVGAPFTPGPWSIYRQPISGAGDAILELVEQVQATTPIGDTLFLINADGKCPAITGCGPTSEANARLIAAAPEYYAAAERLMSSELPEDEDWRDALQALFAAHRKAQGKSA